MWWINKEDFCICVVCILPCLCLCGQALHRSHACCICLLLPHKCAYPNQCRLLTTVVQITIFKVGWFICDAPDTLIISVWIPTVILQQLHLWVKVFSMEHLFGFLRVPWQALSSRHSDWEGPSVKHAFLLLAGLHWGWWYDPWSKLNCCPFLTWKDKSCDLIFALKYH